ncbi:MAG: shikimate kinase [Paracoccaceae bacterium]
MDRTVAMVGMPGSGKTAVGRVLAARLGVPFLDSDAAIVDAAHATIPEIFARDGERFFREREAEVIARLLSGPPAILSTGGGAYLWPATRDAIARSGVALWLDVPEPVLWERVRNKGTRPMLMTDDPRATLRDLMSLRVPHYARAELRLPVCAGASVEDTVAAATVLIQAHMSEVAR